MSDQLKEKINEVAENVVTKETNKNEALLKRHFELAHEIRHYVGQMKQNQLIRLVNGMTKRITGEKLKTTNQTELYVYDLINNLLGLEFLMATSEPSLMKKAQKELRNARTTGKELAESNSQQTEMTLQSKSESTVAETAQVAVTE